MKQWVTLMDGVEALQIQDLAQPTELGNDEVLVKMSRVSLNYRDAQLISGAFKGRYAAPSRPLVPCSDGSGTVVRVGGELAAKTWNIGDRVFSLARPTHLTGPTLSEDHASGIGIPQPGVLTEYRVFPASGLLAIPEYMSLDEACTLPIAAITAWMALNWDQPIGSPRKGAGVTVLIQGTGGVSIAALQQALALGLKTIVTSSSDDKLRKAKDLGATHVINYKDRPDWDAEVLKITNRKGADIIVEIGGLGTMEQSLRAVAEGGNISAIGIVTGSTESKTQMTVGLQLIGRNSSIKGINIGPKDRMEEMLGLYLKRQIRPVVGRTFEFEDVKAAVRSMKDGDHFGKVVIKLD